MCLSVNASVKHMRASAWWIFSLLVLGACNESAQVPPQIRPVRTTVVETRVVGEPIALTGHIRAQDEVNLAFRIDGKLIERLVNVGDRVTVGQHVAKLDPQDELNALRSAHAALAAAQAVVAQVQGTEARQRELLRKGITTRAQYEKAVQQLETARSELDSAEARLRTAEDRVSYTELHADAPGAIIAKGAEPGEVIRAGQMILQVAREGAKDAIFDVPVQLIRAGRAGKLPEVEVYLADNPNVRTIGHVREVSPQADPATRTHQVKIGLVDPPPTMFLGTTVVGRITLHDEPMVELPGTALTQWKGNPAVWVVDKVSETVNLRSVEIARHTASSVIIAKGLQDGELVVIAGAHTLYPDQKVRLTGP
jgi:RND family efflux transporter MFP subunit